jgi:hypothetical protein
MTQKPAPACDEDDEHADGCLCGTGGAVQDHEATGDEHLPAATGGVQGDRAPRRPRAAGLAKLGEL